MNALSSILIWILAGSYFSGVLITILILSRFRSAAEMDPLIKRLVRGLFRIIGSEIVLEFQEPIPHDTPVIFMANHSSLIDIPLLQMVIPRHFVGILAKHQFNFFLYGKTVARLGHLAIDRSNPRASLKIFEQAKRHLKNGTSIVVLPEGGRSLDGHLIPFKKLPFRFAIDADAQIVPISISGAFRMKSKASWKLRPGLLTIRFGSIVTTTAFERNSEGVESLRDHVYQKIYAGLDDFEKGV